MTRDPPADCRRAPARRRDAADRNTARRPAQHELLLAGHVVGHAEARPDVEHRELVGRLRDALADWNRPFVRLPVFGTSVPMASVLFGPRNCARDRIHAPGDWCPEQGYTPFAQPATYSLGAGD